jgi:hypothetical protein
MVLTDPSYRLTDCAGDAGASALGCGRGSPIATTEANGTCQLTDDQVAFNVGLRGTLIVPHGQRLTYVIFDLGEASAVRLFRVSIEERAGVAEPRVRQPGFGGASHGRRWAAFGGDEVQHVELTPGIGEEPGEVSHPLEVPHPDRVPVERDGPVVALAMEDVEAWSTLLIGLGNEVDGRCSVGLVDVPDLLEDDAGCPQLRVRPAGIASGAVRFGQPHSGDRRLVRCADFVPETRRFFEMALCIRGGAFGEPDPPGGESGASRERLAPEPAGHALQLPGSRSGPLEFAGRDLDLDLRLEQRHPTKIRVRRQLLRWHLHRILESVPYGGGRQRHVPLGQTDQGQAGLRVPSGVASGEQGRLRALNVSPSQPDPSKFAQRPAELSP